MATIFSRDLNTVRAQFDRWRARRKPRERIPEWLWKEALRMLRHYPFHKVRKELSLNTKQFRERAEAAGVFNQHSPKKNKASQHSPRSKKAFLELSAGDLAKTLPLSNTIETFKSKEQICRIVFEGSDGSRLILNLPMDWNQIQSICANFIR